MIAVTTTSRSGKHGFVVRIVRTTHGPGNLFWIKERFWGGLSLVENEREATVYPSANAAYHAMVHKFTDQLHPYVSRDIIDIANGTILE